MNQQLPHDTVKHIAKLARIQLTEDEVELFSNQLSQVIDYNMTILNAIDTSNIEPTSQVTGLVNVWRTSDEPQPSMPVELAISQARQSDDDLFVVPKVVGEA